MLVQYLRSGKSCLIQTIYPLTSRSRGLTAFDGKTIAKLRLLSHVRENRRACRAKTSVPSWSVSS